MSLPGPPPPPPPPPSQPSWTNQAAYGQRVVIRPSMGAYLRGAGRSLPVAGTLLLLAVLRGATRPGHSLTGLWIGLGAGLVVGVVTMAVWFGWVRLTLDGDRLEFRGFSGVRRATLADVGGCLVMARMRGNALVPDFPHAVVVDRAGRRIVSLSGQIFEEADLHRLADWASRAVPVQVINEEMTPNEAARRYPGAFNAFMRHPWVFAVIISVVVVTIVVIAAFAAAT